jgi:hypothetical protein
MHISIISSSLTHDATSSSHPVVLEEIWSVGGEAAITKPAQLLLVPTGCNSEHY